MKKKILLALLLALTLCFSSCAGTAGTCIHNWKSATCTAPKTCSSCGEIQGAPLGHTTESGTCSRCGQNFSVWTTGNYVDEFNQPTKRKYIAAHATGTFTNSATTNSKLSAAIQVDSIYIFFILSEYGTHLVRGIYEYETYEVTILDAQGKKHHYEGILYEGESKIVLSANREEVLNILKLDGTIKFNLRSSKYLTSTYVFSFENKGFSEAYNEMSK